MNVRALLGAGIVCVASWVHGAPVEHDLGAGLRLYRIHALPADLPPSAPAGGGVPPCVVDVRYVRADADGAAAFQAWLRSRAKPSSPVFVLANAQTSPALLRVLSEREPENGVMVIGAASGRFEPDISVRISEEDERRAYDALAQGTPVAALLRDNPDKVRNDEASLSRDRVADASAEAAADAAAPKRGAAPPVDAALQRAVHLHRTLVALRRL